MNKPHYLLPVFALLASSLVSVVSMHKAAANVVPTPSRELNPSYASLKSRIISEKEASGAKERALQAVYAMSRTVARKLLEELNELKKIPGNSFDYRIEIFPDGTFDIRTNVKQELTGELITVTARPDGVFCEFLSGEDISAFKADEEGGEEEGPCFAKNKMTNPAEIARHVRQRAEETGKIPWGCPNDNDDRKTGNPPLFPSIQNPRNEENSVDRSDVDGAALADTIIDRGSTARVLRSQTVSLRR
jgi:hypothetical protein